MKLKQLNVRLDPELHKRAKIESAKTGEPLVSIVARLLQEWTTKREKDQKDKEK